MDGSLEGQGGNVVAAEQEEAAKMARETELRQHHQENKGKGRSYRSQADMQMQFEVTFEIFESKFYDRMAIGR